MCGIAGYFEPGGLREECALSTLAAMTAVLTHRGPDDSGVWCDPAAGIALGHRRLSILDLSPLGQQPMTSESGRYVVTFNGEIYNFGALRSELAALGHRFVGRSDTEVLLAAVSQWQVRQAVERFNGMFALALWDRERRTLHLVRDRAGEKPLYYGWTDGILVFGSELKALRAHPAFRPTIDRNAVALFLQHGYVPAPYTIYRGVYKLPPGATLTVRGDRPDPQAAPVAYWSIREAAERGISEPFGGTADDAIAEFDALLRDAVKLRMEADVPLGAFLSGGIDSSTVVALMQAQSTRPVKTFTIGFHEGRYDEARHAAAVARHLETEHTELYVTPGDALAVIPRLPTLYDEPFADVSQIPTFLLSELTRRHVTVSLSGDAGDELLGGYPFHRLGPAIWRAIRWIPPVVRRGLGAALLRPSVRRAALVQALGPLTRRLTGKRNLRERLRQTGEILTVQSGAALHRYLMSYWKAPAAVVFGADEPLGPTSNGKPGGVGIVLPDGAHEAMYLDQVTFLPDDILVKVDRASMGVSLEARVPLLDHRVIEFAWRLPLRLKIRHGSGKWILRQVLDRYVPRALVDRPKQGFGIPVAAWLRGPLRGWAEALLDESRLRTAGVLDPRPIRRKWAEHLSGQTSWDYDLWCVLMFQAWFEANQPSSEWSTRQSGAASVVTQPAAAS